MICFSTFPGRVLNSWRLDFDRFIESYSFVKIIIINHNWNWKGIKKNIPLMPLGFILKWPSPFLVQSIGYVHWESVLHRLERISVQGSQPDLKSRLRLQMPLDQCFSRKTIDERLWGSGRIIAFVLHTWVQIPGGYRGYSPSKNLSQTAKYCISPPEMTK